MLCDLITPPLLYAKGISSLTLQKNTTVNISTYIVFML